MILLKTEKRARNIINNFCIIIMLIVSLNSCDKKKEKETEGYFLCNKNERICMRTQEPDSNKLKSIETIFFENKKKFLENKDVFIGFENSYDIDLYLKESDYLVIDNKDNGQKIVTDFEKNYLDGLMKDLKKQNPNLINDIIYLEKFRLPLKWGKKTSVGISPPSLRGISFDYYYNNINDNFND